MTHLFKNSILVTGASGFLGSSLVAQLSALNFHVICLSRNDKNGLRTLSQIKDASIGYNLNLDLTNITILPLPKNSKNDFQLLSKILRPYKLQFIFHCAANMGYAPSELKECLDFNQDFSVKFYQWAKTQRPSLKRFFYISTAYSSGILRSPIYEDIHQDPNFVNSYQISKWAAETSLLSLAQNDPSLPLSVVRPTIITGHRVTGWGSKKSFGFNLFLSTFLKVHKKSIPQFHIDLNPKTPIDLITIDQVTTALVQLMEKNHRLPFSQVFHLVAKRSPQIQTGQILKLIENFLGLKILCAPPKTRMEKRLDQFIQKNKTFAKHHWPFVFLNYSFYCDQYIEALSASEIQNILSFFYQDLKLNKEPFKYA